MIAPLIPPMAYESRYCCPLTRHNDHQIYLMMISDNGWDYSWTRQPQTYDDGASSSHGALQLPWPDQGLVLQSRDTPDKDGPKHRINI